MQRRCRSGACPLTGSEYGSTPCFAGTFVLSHFGTPRYRLRNTHDAVQRENACTIPTSRITSPLAQHTRADLIRAMRTRDQYQFS